MAEEYKFLDSNGLKALTKEILSISGSGGSNPQNLITNEFDETDTNNNPTDKALSAKRLHDVLYEFNQSIFNKFSTKLDTANAIKNIINSAPEALDTLKELADALGNDANFAATVTNKLAAKADKIETESKLNNKLDKNGTAENSLKLAGISHLNYLRQYTTFVGGFITEDIFNDPAHPEGYMGDINYGIAAGLPCNYVKIIYFPHKPIGYGTQVAIGYESGETTWGVYFRNAVGTNWKPWVRIIDAPERERSELTVDANTCMDSCRMYYCSYKASANLPLGNNTDDGILIPYMYIKNVWGFQIYMTWNGSAIYWRRMHNKNWDSWQCIGGGSWNQEIIKDSQQVFKWMRWNNYGQNHVIFDASQGIRPDGRSCDRYIPEKGWHEAICPTLMGFNGSYTWGVKVSNAGWADGAGGIQGFAFRNNNGVLEFFEQGVWKAVSGGGTGMGYTVVRQGELNSTGQNFTYNGGPGIIRIIKWEEHNQLGDASPVIQIDGIDMNEYYAKNYYFAKATENNRFGVIKDIEFKNSISITKSSSIYNLFYFIQTEK